MRSPLRPLIAVVGLLAGILVAPAAAAAAVPPQEPGVTLRVFDVQVPLSEICDLKPSQTPNVDKLMPTINWTSTTDFGFSDNFVSQVIGNINIATAGSYTFRLSSDDGSRLTIDSTVVVDHDGLHGASPPKEGTITLTTGYHALRIDHFERAGDQQITLDWRTPGSSTFVLVPNSVLSTDAGVVRVTAPGRKECEGVTDAPGDGLPLNAVHPNYTLTNLRPTGFQPQVSAMDWLPDGRLAITTWGGSDTVAGEVYLLSNVTGATSPSQVTYQRIATGLREPMGIKYVDGKLYVSEKHRLVELNDTNGDWVTDTYRQVATWPWGGNFHEFAFGLLYQAPYFYLNLSISINYGGATTNPQPAPNRGSSIRIDKNTGAVHYVAGGLRTPDGIGWGPEGGIFVTDNQGDWLPASKLVHIKQDRFFNLNMNPPGPFQNQPVTQPVLWMPQNEIANSPSTPVLVPSGPYAGQLLIGDVTYGGLQRAFLEKINGEYQGALFRHTQGLEMGVLRTSIGPDGAIYVGGLGAGGNWGQEGKLTYGLQKLTPNGGNAFDILAMRAIASGFELEYTQPLSAATIASLATKFQVKQWRYVPTQNYGGPKVDEQTLSVTSATASTDGRKVTLKINGLQSGRVVYVRSPRPFAAANGQELWSTEAWYTLNAQIGGPQQPGGALEAESAVLTGGASVATDHVGYTGAGFVAGYGTQGATTTFSVPAAAAGSYDLNLRYSNGPNGGTGTKTVSLYVNGTKLRQTQLPFTNNWDTWAVKAEAVTLNAGTNTVAYRYDAGDIGHVNLDNITVTGGPPTAGTIVGIGGKCLDVNNAGTADGTKIQLWTCNGSAAQQWTRVGDTFRALGKCLDIDNAGTADGTKVQLWNCNGTGAQVWQPQANGSILNPQSGKVLDALGGSSADGTQIHIWTYVNAASQRWTVGSGGPARIVLFDGAAASLTANWQHTDGRNPTWTITGGGMQVAGGDIRTRQAFGDYKLHVEFWLPQYGPEVTGQARANSGVYQQDRYELQVLDSFGDTSLGNDEAASIYQKKAADTNAATAPQTWQSYDITFRAARFNGTTKTEDARMTVVWNGVTVHNNVAVNGPTGAGAAEANTPGPIRLQDHGNPIRYRNIWIEPA
ncbi:glucose/arabinose dehydrogenase [Asanoa ferruginea]|uniref:Glucose/arabinose dehydrogenase n=1 Tax=Asanoa ferruginea TaxID=53367 RepID=A0A3D9ZRT3_9ACTN|nr:glucose/arabinose dehydrogenase [Asanoa ferruginea]